MSTVQVVQGFSLTNRWLLYASVMLAPAQFASGWNNNCPSNLGFLAYNWYTQISWFQAVQAKELHALSMLLPHFNLIYAISYLGGISSGNPFMGLFLGIGTAGVLGINTAAAWIGWKTNQPEGFGIYRFFFFGWRTLTADWHKFLLVWQIFDTMTAVSVGISAIVISVQVGMRNGDEDDIKWPYRYLAIPLGAVLALIFAWPLILWTELIVASNHIESATDWVAVWLFVAQVGAMLIPPCSAFLGCFRRRG